MNISLKRRERDFEIDHNGEKVLVTMQSIKSTELDEIVLDAQTQIQVMQKQIREKQEELAKAKKGKPNKKDVETAQKEAVENFGATTLKMQVEGQCKRLVLQIKKWNVEEDGKPVPINIKNLLLIRDFEPELFEEFCAKAAEVQTVSQKIKEEVEKNSASGPNIKPSK